MSTDPAAASSLPTSSTSGRAAAVHALLDGIVDYAGLFPPAALDMAGAVQAYARHLASPESWMLSRLIVPVARLDEFEQAAATLLPRDESDEPWVISALTAPAADPALRADLARIAAFNDAHADPRRGLAIIDAIELRAADAASIDRVLDEIADDLFPFFELPAEVDVRGPLAALVDADAGAKIRTGGTTPDLHPSSARLAAFIAHCAAVGVPFKATAGLHHPLRHRHATLDCDEHGFLNVFVAAVFALHAGLDEAQVAELLEERTLDAFGFEDDGISWRERTLSVEAAEDARLAFAVSFGSCSFDEPVADLRGLGLI